MKAKKTKLRAGIFLCLCVIMVSISIVLLVKEQMINQSAFLTEQTTKQNSIQMTEMISQPLQSKLDLSSQQALLIRLEDGEVLLDINREQKIYPASLTKIMTAIIAIEYLSDMEELVFLEEEIFSYLYIADASMAGFWPNESVQAVDLLYGVILSSGAECSVGLAMHISGSESNFVELMNQKAKALGMEDTHFTNVTGLHDDNHYSTVEDIAVLLEYALQNDIFRQIFTSSQYSTAATNIHSEGMTLYSTMFQLMDGAEFDEGVILGGKTGYTSEAGQCLASMAAKEGIEYILVTAGAKGTPQTEPLHIRDTLEIYSNYLPD